MTIMSTSKRRYRLPKSKYRLLADMEVIEEGDEFTEDGTTWRKTLNYGRGYTAGWSKSFGNIIAYRRPLKNEKIQVSRKIQNQAAI